MLRKWRKERFLENELNTKKSAPEVSILTSVFEASRSWSSFPVMFTLQQIALFLINLRRPWLGLCSLRPLFDIAPLHISRPLHANHHPDEGLLVFNYAFKPMTKKSSPTIITK